MPHCSNCKMLLPWKNTFFVRQLQLGPGSGGVTPCAHWLDRRVSFFVCPPFRGAESRILGEKRRAARMQPEHGPPDSFHAVLLRRDTVLAFVQPDAAQLPQGPRRCCFGDPVWCCSCCLVTRLINFLWLSARLLSLRPQEQTPSTTPRPNCASCSWSCDGGHSDVVLLAFRHMYAVASGPATSSFHK